MPLSDKDEKKRYSDALVGCSGMHFVSTAVEVKKAFELLNCLHAVDHYFISAQSNGRKTV